LAPKLWQMVISIGIIVGAWLVSLVLTKILQKLFAKIPWEEGRQKQLLDAVAPSMRFFLLLAGIWFVTQVVALPAWLDDLMSRLMRTLVLVGIFAGLYRGAELLSEFLSSFVNRGEDYVELLLPMLRKAVKIVVVLLGAIAILEDWGVDVAGLLAGLGLGGLALALAAKDTAANFIGGLTLMFERPFGVGDWIVSGPVEGMVEELGIRSTKIRTFAQAQVTVPNSTLAGDVITNWSRMGKRRYTFSFKVAVETPPEKLDQFIQRLREFIKNHPGIHPDMIFVYFNAFGESSLDVFVYCFTRSIVWKEYLEVVHEINLGILTIAEEMDIKFAYPTRTLHIANSNADQ
jgi:MscS family membrane protein